MGSIDELVERKVEEKVKELIGKEEKRRKNQNAIRDEIQFELDKRPKTKHELTNAIRGTSKRTVGRHLDHLQELKVVSTFEKDSTTYWRLAK